MNTIKYVEVDLPEIINRKVNFLISDKNYWKILNNIGITIKR